MIRTGGLGTLHESPMLDIWDGSLDHGSLAIGKHAGTLLLLSGTAGPLFPFLQGLAKGLQRAASSMVDLYGVYSQPMAAD